MTVLLKPDERMLRNLFKGAGLFEEMRGARHDHKTFKADEEPVGRPIHLDEACMSVDDAIVFL